MPGEQSSDLNEGSDIQQVVTGLFEGEVYNAFAGHVFVFDDDLHCSVEHPQECRDHPTRPMSQCPSSQLMRGLSEPPVLEPGRYTIRVDRGAVLFDKDDNARPRGLLDRLEQGLHREGGQLVVTASPDRRREWTVGLTFGEEAQDSPMAGGAAYGMADNLQDALRAALDEAGWQ